MTRDIFVPPQGPPAGGGPPPEIFKAMGEDDMFRMLEDVYRELGRSGIRHLFPATEAGRRDASRRSAAFFIQVTGGPPHYTKQFGPPQMRKRHLPFVIDEAARQEWLRCFNSVLDNAPDAYGFPVAHLSDFRQWLSAFSAWMVNSAS